jgi:hypothetical protein
MQFPKFCISIAKVIKKILCQGFLGSLRYSKYAKGMFVFGSYNNLKPFYRNYIQAVIVYLKHFEDKGFFIRFSFPEKHIYDIGK